MIHENIPLPVQYTDKGVKRGSALPYMTTYILDNYDEIDAERKRPLVVICPGGGYEHLSNREAEAVAIKMNAAGFHAVVVWYSLAPMDFPAALLDLCEAVRFVRTHAALWHVDEKRIIVGGFSAGGHLAASLGVYWNAPLIGKYLPYGADEVRPDGLLLSYPVITAGEFAHTGSIRNVLGGTAEFTAADVSLETLVTGAVPPVFMWHTDTDTCVPPENSLRFAAALRTAGVSLEYHLFRRGVHGIGLATAETSAPDGSAVQPECAVWADLFAVWLKNL
ncbi:alpha/beta hydrolase [Treponema brennaborense]|uniref:Acetyl esterase n=1 Tax=Treponema brennaborense (strain DSM 12168 / CIP 105900 / DD5/3) TaxID=906968 RepID=F4LNW5_TREBD|nr:alpha/beta hydrolase [Treponema brennaborense]AEE17942.1 acetyl esterase [Treponema brennaborense DSM 12168]